MSLKPAWDSLVHKSVFPHVYFTHGYCFAWWSIFAKENLLRVVVIEDESGVRLIAPLCATKENPGIWIPMGAAGADYTSFITTQGDQEAIAAFWSFLKTQTNWESVQLMDLPVPASHAIGVTAVERGASKSEFIEKIVAEKFPLALFTMKLDHPHMFRADIVEHQNVLQTKNYRKHVNWLKRQADLRYEVIKDAKQIESLLPNVIEMHRKKWSTKGSGSYFDKPDVQKFMLALVRAMSEYQCLRLDRLLLGDKCIAVHLGFEWKGRIYWYITAYDPDYHSHSPGKILLAHLFEAAAKDPSIEEIDFLRGREAYKDNYAKNLRQTAALNVFRTRMGLAKTYLEKRVLKAA